MRKSILVGLFLVLVVTLYTPDSKISLITVNSNKSNSAIPSDYVVHDPILIANNSDFEIQGWPGNGTSEDPYVIEGISINAAKGVHCIEIRNTRAIFVVKGSYLSHYGDEWIGGSHSSTGIRLFNSTYGTIESNTFDSNGVGVYILMSNNTSIDDNDFSGMYDNAIRSSVSSHVTISDNICDSYEDGISFTDSGWDTREGEKYSGISNEITIINNIVNSDRVGIELYVCISGIIMNNTGFSNWDIDAAGAETRGANFGIYHSENLLFTNNTGIAKGVSISITDSSNISVVGNSFTSLEFLHPAYDETQLAFFDYNYYSNYDGIDDDGDGIGDTSYFDLYGSIQDEHPLMYYPWYNLTTTTGVPFPVFIIVAIAGAGVAALIVVIVLKRK